MRDLSRLLWVNTLLLVGGGSGQAATIGANSLSFDDVDAAVRDAADGDTVRIPPGELVWTNQSLVITKRIQIVGAGEDLTIIHRGSNTSSLIIFAKTVSDPQTIFGISNLTLDCDGSLANNAFCIGGSLSETNRYFRIHHVKFKNMLRRGMTAYGRVEGVIDHCYFYAPFNASAQGIEVHGIRRAYSGGAATNNANSTTGIVLGQQKDFLYIEDCVFDYVYPNDSAVELYEDAEAVIRHNSITNTGIGVHEFGMNRSGCAWEFYNNHTVNPEEGYMTIRSGWGVIFSNVLDVPAATAATGAAHPRLTVYRASGTNVFPARPGAYVYDTGVTGTNRMDGNQNDIIPGYPAFDQPGWGDPTVWTITNSIQTLHGVYSWGNTCNGVDSPTVVFCPGNADTDHANDGLFCYDGVRYLATPSQLIVEGRDYFNGTEKPGYTPLTYPHPLVISDSPILPPRPVSSLHIVASP